MPRQEARQPRSRTPASPWHGQRGPQAEAGGAAARERRAPSPAPSTVAAGFGLTALQRHLALLRDARLGQPAHWRERALLVQQLQRGYGNAYVQRLAEHAARADTTGAGGGPSPMVQAALEEGRRGDAYPVGPDVEARIEGLRGAGQPLAPDVRRDMEAAFGHRFDTVRVHAGPEADHLNRQVHALAFTTGSDIFFRHGTYAPQSEQGRELLAHELAHVVQQGGGVQRRPQGAPSPAAGGLTVQRAVGFEFETPWITRQAVPPLTDPEKGVYFPEPKGPPQERQDDKGNPVGPADGKLFSLQKGFTVLKGEGFEAQADERKGGGTDLEFVTAPFDETRDGRKGLQKAMETITRLCDQLSGGPVNVQAEALKSFGTPVIPHAVISKFGSLTGNPQATGAVRLDMLAQMMESIGAQDKDLSKAGPEQLMAYQRPGAEYDFTLMSEAPALAKSGLQAWKDRKAKAGDPVPDYVGSKALVGLMALLITYLRKGDGFKFDYAKLIAPLMARTDFARMFQALPPNELVYFALNLGDWVELVVGSARVSGGAGDPLFKKGLQGDAEGKLSALTREDWLKNIAAGTDLLTKQHFPDKEHAAELESLGALGGKTEQVGKDRAAAPIFEFRRMRANMPYKEWQGLALDVFDFLKAVNEQKDVAFQRKNR